MSFIDYDFIEIGTSNFDTLIEKADDKTIGISVDAVKYYVDSLPDKKNVKKINCAISNVNGTINVYYIPERLIEKYNLPKWLKGCNCINHYHPAHFNNYLFFLCQVDKVSVIPISELFYNNKVRGVKCLKIDTEGHDCIILENLYNYIKPLSDLFYPEKIWFESNQWSKIKDVDNIVNSYCSLGYVLESRSSETILVYKK